MINKNKAEKLTDYERNRRRNITHTLRVSEVEEAIIQARMKRTNLNFTEFMIQMAINEGRIVIENYDAIEALSYEMNRIGNNINQIAHKVNANNFVQSEDIRNLKKQHEQLWKEINRMMKEIRKESN